ncbi:MAG: sulfatase-like hydrolase/transferase [Alphaproteobacteria bacterium]|nr:sulfatase-like hydrolase/transferase [Alphaproteobacteria bacterium]
MSALEPSRRELLAAGAAAATGVASGPALARRRREARRPHVLFITLDQSNDLTWLDEGRVATPNLRRLMARGTRFSTSYCSMPSCSPARSTWWTGRYPSETGVVLIGQPMIDGVPDLGRWMQEQGGYESVYLGKWHLEGRDVFQSFRCVSRGLNIGLQGDVPLTSMARAILQDRSPDRPLFLTVNLLNPHDICIYRKGLARGLTPEDVGLDPSELPPLPPNFKARPPEAALFQQVKRPGKKDYGPTYVRMFQWYYERYLEMVDGAVGAILQALEASPYARETAVILTSDHGDAIGQHGLIFKSSLYEAAARVPLLVSWPGELPEGLVVDEPVDGTRIAPTICELAGVNAPPGVIAPSLMPLLRGEPGRGWAAAQALVEGRMIRTRDYKYVAFRGDPVEQLFHLAEDPWEMKSVAEEGAHASALEEHRRLLREWEATLVDVPVARGSYAEARKGPEDDDEE